MLLLRGYRTKTYRKAVIVSKRVTYAPEGRYVILAALCIIRSNILVGNAPAPRSRNSMMATTSNKVQSSDQACARDRAICLSSFVCPEGQAKSESRWPARAPKISNFFIENETCRKSMSPLKQAQQLTVTAERNNETISNDEKIASLSLTMTGSGCDLFFLCFFFLPEIFSQEEIMLQGFEILVQLFGAAVKVFHGFL